MNFQENDLSIENVTAATMQNYAENVVLQHSDSTDTRNEK